jgi:hypothetical protein
MRFLQHLFQIGIEDARLQAVPLRELFPELMIGFGDSHDLQVPPALKLIEESEGMAMYEPGKRNAQGRFFRLQFRLRLRSQIRTCAGQQSHDRQEKAGKTISSHIPPFPHLRFALSGSGCQALASAAGAQTNQKVDRTREKQRR